MKMRLINKFIFIKISILVLVLSACENDIEKIKAIANEKELPAFTIYDIESQYTENAEIKMKMYSEEVKQFSEVTTPYTEFPKGLKVLFYDNKQEVRSEMKANYAIYHEQQKLWEAQDDVEIINRDGEVLNTELIFADTKIDKLYSTEYVKITTSDGSVISGNEGFESNFDFTAYKFHDVSGIINIKDND